MTQKSKDDANEISKTDVRQVTFKPPVPVLDRGRKKGLAHFPTGEGLPSERQLAFLKNHYIEKMTWGDAAKAAGYRIKDASTAASYGNRIQQRYRDQIVKLFEDDPRTNLEAFKNGMAEGLNATTVQGRDLVVVPDYHARAKFQALYAAIMGLEAPKRAEVETFNRDELVLKLYRQNFLQAEDEEPTSVLIDQAMEGDTE